MNDGPADATGGPTAARGRAVTPTRCYLVCATQRSGSTLLCEGLDSTGVAGRPREYFEELKETGLPRRPREYFWALRSPEVFQLLPQESQLDRDAERSATWSREDYARHLEAALLEGTTPNGVFAAKLMWSYFNDFMALMRGIPRLGGMGDGSLLNAAFPGPALRVRLAQRQGAPGRLAVAGAADVGVAQGGGRAAGRAAAGPALGLLLRRDRSPARAAAPP